MSRKQTKSEKSTTKGLGDEQFTVLYRLTSGRNEMYCINEEQVKVEAATDDAIVIDYALVTHYEMEDGRHAFHLTEIEDSTWNRVKDVELL